jgi:prophage antirepressor-like protein
LNITKNKQKGIFVGDSPVDLLGLYHSQMKAINKKNGNKTATEEANFIVKYLLKKIGTPKDNMDKYYEYSPFINNNVEKSNLRYLTDYHIHFYSEPDLNWFKEMLDYEDYEDINSFKIDQLKAHLDKVSKKTVFHTKTKNKGFKGNEKNPHSWSIIDENDFYKWIIQCKD